MGLRRVDDLKNACANCEKRFLYTQAQPIQNESNLGTGLSNARPLPTNENLAASRRRHHRKTRQTSARWPLSRSLCGLVQIHPQVLGDYSSASGLQVDPYLLTTPLMRRS